jgi:hypothetical protein
LGIFRQTFRSCEEKSLTGEARIDHFAPLSETSAYDFSVDPGRQQMPACTKERCDYLKSSEKPLGVPDGLKASHAAFSFAGGLMRILRPIVQPALLLMLHRSVAWDVLDAVPTSAAMAK